MTFSNSFFTNTFSCLCALFAQLFSETGQSTDFTGNLAPYLIIMRQSTINVDSSLLQSNTSQLSLNTQYPTKQNHLFRSQLYIRWQRVFTFLSAVCTLSTGVHQLSYMSIKLGNQELHQVSTPVNCDWYMSQFSQRHTHRHPKVHWIVAYRPQSDTPSIGVTQSNKRS